MDQRRIAEGNRLIQAFKRFVEPACSAVDNSATERHLQHRVEIQVSIRELFRHESVQRGHSTDGKGVAHLRDDLLQTLELLASNTKHRCLPQVCLSEAGNVANLPIHAPDEFTRQLAATFVGWGIPTSDSILNVKNAVPEMTIFASGGIKDGLDIAKCIALGATLGGMAGQFLKAAAVSTEKAIEMMKLTKRQIEVTMFAAGVVKLEGFKVGKLIELK